MKAKIYAVPSFILFLILSVIILSVGCFSILGERSAFVLNGVYIIMFLSALSVVGLGYSAYENMQPAIANKHIRQAISTVPPALALTAFLFFFIFAAKAYLMSDMAVNTQVAAQQIIYMVFNISIGLQSLYLLGIIGLLVYKRIGLKEISFILFLLLVILLLTAFWDMFVYSQNTHFMAGDNYEGLVNFLRYTLLKY